MRYFDIKVMIVANGININRIINGGVPSLSGITQAEFDNNTDEIIKQVSWEYLPPKYTMGNTHERTKKIIESNSHISYGNENTVWFLYENDKEYTQQIIDKVMAGHDDWLLENVPNTENDLSNMEYFFLSEHNTKVIDLRKEYMKHTQDIDAAIASIVDSLRVRFPLVFGVDDNESAVLEYVEFINSKRYNDKQTKVA